MKNHPGYVANPRYVVEDVTTGAMWFLQDGKSLYKIIKEIASYRNFRMFRLGKSVKIVFELRIVQREKKAENG